jgi:hypothetical protein
MVEAMILAVDPGYVLRWDELCREQGELVATQQLIK